MLPTITLHASALLVRRNSGVLAWRIVLEITASALLGWCAALAWDRIRVRVDDPRTWAAGAGIALIGLALHVILRVVYRAGTIRVMHARLRGADDAGVFVEGARAFVQAFTSTYLLALLDAAWVGCVMLELVLALRAGMTWLGALVITVTALAGLIASTLGTFAYVLGLLDDCDAAQAWPRLRALLPQARGRFLPLAVLLLALGSLLNIVDQVSMLTAQAAGDWPALLIFVPLLSAFVACVIDVAMLLFVAALTDRLPLGLAARVSIV